MDGQTDGEMEHAPQIQADFGISIHLACPLRMLIYRILCAVFHRKKNLEQEIGNM